MADHSELVECELAMSEVSSARFRAGDWVRVRSKEQILATLDATGKLDALPFMPEMFQYCGRAMQVGKRAHKTCDPALGIRARKMDGTVHLDSVRCDGAAHDGCQAACLIFWKEAWLEPLDGAPASQDGALAADARPAVHPRCSEEHLQSFVKTLPPDGEPIYMCQNTEIKHATRNLPWWDLRQYLEDYTSGNVGMSQLAAGLLYSLWRTIAEAGVGVGAAMRWSYDRFQRIIGGSPYPLRPFGIPQGVATPKAQLDLQPGEVVRVKPFGEILKTLDSNYRNRGLYFDPEMVPFTERQYEVDRRIVQIIDEHNGRMIRFKTDAIVLKNVVCQSRYAYCRRFCPRAIPPYWREIWLERVTEGPTETHRPATAETKVS